jgi:hypothetical protein
MDHESGHPQWQMSGWQPSTTWAFATDSEWIQEFCSRMGWLGMEF